MSEELDLQPPPVPAPAFRGELLRHLLDEGVPGRRPERLWLLVVGLALGGAVLLVLATTGIPS